MFAFCERSLPSVTGTRSCEGGSHMVAKQQLEEALARFNDAGATSAKLLGAAIGRGTALRSIRRGPEAWSHAFSIAAALLRGVHQQLPRAVRTVG